MAEERKPYERRHNSEDDIAMNLPDGKTCGDCYHFNRCKSIFGHISGDQVCDWYPSRFMEAK